MKKALIVLAAVLVVLVGCGGESNGDPEGPGGSGNKVTVTFLYNYEGAPDNGVYQAVEITKGTKVAKPAVGTPPREGTWNRLGWFEEYDAASVSVQERIPGLFTERVKEAGVKEFNFDVAVTENCNVYMRWNKEQKYFNTENDTNKESLLEYFEEYFEGKTGGYLYYENNHGEVLCMALRIDNEFVGIEIEKFLDVPLVVAGVEYASFIVGKEWDTGYGFTWMKSGNNLKIKNIVPDMGSLIYLKDGWIGVMDYGVFVGLEECFIYSYSEDYVEVGEGGFWRPGKYYIQTKKGLYRERL